jgi:general secretion pathway protein E
MIGEIRDLETAQIAVQASLTGHLVLATLHTNDATSAVTRLADMGVESYLLASSLLGVLAQRLVRRLCPVCRTAEGPSTGEQKLLHGLGLPATQPVWTAPGCDECNHTGFRGRTGVYELLLIDDAMRRHIHDGTSERVARRGDRCRYDEPAPRQRRLLADGTTSLAELLRVTRDA